MKIRNKLLAGIASLALAGGAVLATGPAALATYETPPEECVPTEEIPGYWEDVPDITHPAVGTPTIVIENPDYVPGTEGTAAVWANFSPNKDQKTFVGPPLWPTDERGTWQLHDKIPGGHEGPDGVYSKGNPHKGGDWFYRQAAVPGTDPVGTPTIEVTNPDYEPEWIEVTPNIWHDPVPATECPEEPEEPGAANPAADLKALCGEATLTLTNDGENILTASFVVNVNGEFYGAYAVAAGESEDVDFTFAEDTGDHLIEVYQSGTSDWKLIESGTVPSDCIEPQPEDLVTVGEWSEPVITCDNKVGDEISISRFDTVTPFILVEGQWVLNEEAAETVEVKDVYVVTQADIDALDCPVVTPPTEEPPVEEPKPEEPKQETPAPAAVQPPLAATGGVLNPYVPVYGALAVVLGIAAFTFGAIHNSRRKAAEVLAED